MQASLGFQSIYAIKCSFSSYGYQLYKPKHIERAIDTACEPRRPKTTCASPCRYNRKLTEDIEEFNDVYCVRDKTFKSSACKLSSNLHSIYSFA